MIRVLRVVTRLNIGGPTHHVRLLSVGLPRARFQTLVVAGHPSPEEGDLTSELKRQAHVIVIPQLGRALHPWRDAVAWWKLLVIAVRFQPDIVHTHMAKAGALGRVAAWMLNLLRRLRRRVRCRVIHTFHGHVLDGYFSSAVAKAFVWCERWLARRSDRLIAVNETVKHQLLEFRIGRAEQIVTIPLGLSLEPLLSLSGRPAATVGSPAPWRIGMVGRLVPVKNHELFFQALRAFGAAAPERSWSALIVGDGPLRPRLERTAEALGLNGRVQFCGWQNALDSVYNGVHVVCLTSKNEGTPVALIESLAAGRPVIATDVGGVGELLGAYCPPDQPFVVAPRGMVVRPDDADALAQALAWAERHRAEHQHTADQGRAHVRTQFSAQRLVSDMDLFYQQVMARRRTTCMR